MSALTYFIISVDGTRSVSNGYRQRRTKSPITLYIRQAHFAMGDGYRVTKVGHTSNKADAYKFSKLAAQGIARDLQGRWRLKGVAIEPVLNQEAS